VANVGPLEILVVLIIALVMFGPKRIPELGQSLGKGIREFKAALEGSDSEPPDRTGTEIARSKAVDAAPADTSAPDHEKSSEAQR
jgi:TatA/E family protein of Tat protein translocase